MTDVKVQEPASKVKSLGKVSLISPFSSSRIHVSGVIETVKSVVSKTTLDVGTIVTLLISPEVAVISRPLSYSSRTFPNESRISISNDPEVATE